MRVDVSKQIVGYVTHNQNQTATQIAAALGLPDHSVKMALWKMAKSGKIVRAKVEATNYKAGPKHHYTYTVQ